MQYDNSSPETYFKTLRILHLGLVSGLVLMCLLIGWMLQNDGVPSEKINWLEGFPLYSLVVLLVQIPLSFLIWNKRQASIPTGASLDARLTHYRVSCLIRWAIIDSAAIVAIIFAFISGRVEVLAVAAAGIAALFLAKPSLDYFKENYKA